MRVVGGLVKNIKIRGKCIDELEYKKCIFGKSIEYISKTAGVMEIRANLHINDKYSWVILRINTNEIAMQDISLVLGSGEEISVKYVIDSLYILREMENDYFIEYDNALVEKLPDDIITSVYDLVINLEDEYDERKLPSDVRRDIKTSL